MLIIKSFIICNIITLSIYVKNGECKNYCNSDFCIDPKDTLCKFKAPGPGKDCLNYEKLLKTERDKQEILKKINHRRNKVASGGIRSLPPSGNMLKMEWNEELEISAQRWADQCSRSSVDDMRDVCRDSENERVGQNIATVYGDVPGLTVATLVDIWYMELLNINGSIITRYRPSSLASLYDNFTQLVWAESWRVGCGAVKFWEFQTGTDEDKNQTVNRLVCNFAPSGNRFGEAVYVTGSPCSRCPSDRSCDTEFKNLCSRDIFLLGSDTPIKYNFSMNHFNEIINLTEYEQTTERVNTAINNYTTEYVTEEDTQLDFLSDLFEITKAHSLTDQSTLRCNDFLAVDEFIELLKSRLSNDHILKNLLITSTQLDSPDTSFTDRTVAAMINQIYSSKVTSTTTRTTVNDYINSTLLVDLVEAVIFRHSGPFSTTEDIKTFTNYAPDFSVVKVQAQLSEIKANNEFTGHYFFPEDESVETSINDDSTETYYDSENLAGSEISLEIDDLKRQRETKDFIEDILESYMATENVKDITLPDLNNIQNESQTRKKLNNNSKYRNRMLNNVENKGRYKRGIKILKLHSDSLKLTADGTFVNYEDLLRILAIDLRNLKLNERFNCAHNSEQMISATFILNLLLVSINFRS